MKSIAPAFLLVLAFGATASNAAVDLDRAGIPPDENPAVLALLEAAEQELEAGRPDQAAPLLERALRIEPRDPTVWHYLGLVRLEQGNYAQAAAMAAKSHNLAARDRALRSRNARLTAAARREPQDRAEQPFQWAPPVPEQPAVVEQPPAWRQPDDYYAELVRRQREARRGRIESQPIPEARHYRRRSRNVVVRLQI
jgi:tetratricopeptide (TPR) repeat protein